MKFNKNGIHEHKLNALRLVLLYADVTIKLIPKGTIKTAKTLSNVALWWSKWRIALDKNQ